MIYSSPSSNEVASIKRVVLGVTVTVHVAVKPPSFVVAVITAVPSETPVTVPLLLTVATLSELLLQVTP